MPGLPRSWTEMEAYTSCNLLATYRLVEASRAAGIRRYIQISTSSVYGTEAVGDESQPLRPISPYGVTKLAAEQLVLAYVQTYGFPAAILRYFSIYGPRQRPDMAYHKFIEALIDQQDLTVFGDGHQSRSSTFVSDAVDGTLRALEGAEVGEVYNIGGGERVELLDVIRIIGDELGVEPVIQFEIVPARGPAPHRRGYGQGRANVRVSAERGPGRRPARPDRLALCQAR